MKAFKIFFQNCVQVSNQSLSADTIPESKQSTWWTATWKTVPSLCVPARLFDSLTTYEFAPMQRSRVVILYSNSDDL
jgi:hypothetical protein